VLEDSTGGFNLGSGSTTLQLPAASAIQSLAGHRLHWLRCGSTPRPDRANRARAYTHPPVIRELTAAPVGALLPVAHAAVHGPESLGVGEGLPGASYTLTYRPVLSTGHGERLEVRVPGAEDWQRWELRESFAASGPGDRHFVLDLATGEVELGPSIRQPTAAGGSTARFLRRARRSASAVIATAVGARETSALGSSASSKRRFRASRPCPTPVPAGGGVDAESLESARARAAFEFRTRYRAVTADDYEFLAVDASPRIARAHCPTPAPGAPIQVFLIPSVEPADRRIALDELTPSQDALAEGRGLPRRAAPDRDERRTPAHANVRPDGGGQRRGRRERRARAGGGGRGACPVPLPESADRGNGAGRRQRLAVWEKPEPGASCSGSYSGSGASSRSRSCASTKAEPVHGKAIAAAGGAVRRNRTRPRDRVRHAHRQGGVSG